MRACPLRLAPDARTKASLATTAAVMAAAAPASSPARGPAAPASQPTSGAPIGVEPRKTIEYSAMTRPRMAGATAICRAELTPAANVTLAAPSGTRAAIWSARVGAAAASSSETPKASEEPDQQPGVDAPARARGQRASDRADAHRRRSAPHSVAAVPCHVKFASSGQQHLEVEGDRPDQRHHRQRDQQLGRAARRSAAPSAARRACAAQASGSAAPSGPSPATRGTSPGTRGR